MTCALPVTYLQQKRGGLAFFSKLSIFKEYGITTARSYLHTKHI